MQVLLRVVLLVVPLVASLDRASAQSWIVEGVQGFNGPSDLRYARGVSVAGTGRDFFFQADLVRESADRRRNFCAGLINPEVGCPPDATHVKASLLRLAVGYAGGKPTLSGGVRAGGAFLDARWTRDQQLMHDEERWYGLVGGHVATAYTLRPQLRLRAAVHMDLQFPFRGVDCADCYTAYFDPFLMPSLRLGLEYVRPAGSR